MAHKIRAKMIQWWSNALHLEGFLQNLAHYQNIQYQHSLELGIAHCVQDIPSVRYCSIHEELSSYSNEGTNDSNPRSPDSEDSGPLGNILNINLGSNTGWDNGYREALVNKALPFLKETNPDVLLVASGFDALEADLTSKLKLQPRDFRELGAILKAEFGSKVAFGLEGGYCWQNGELSDAIAEFVSPWQ